MAETADTQSVSASVLVHRNLHVRIMGRPSAEVDARTLLVPNHGDVLRPKV